MKFDRRLGMVVAIAASCRDPGSDGIAPTSTSAAIITVVSAVQEVTSPPPLTATPSASSQVETPRPPTDEAWKASPDMRGIPGALRDQMQCSARTIDGWVRIDCLVFGGGLLVGKPEGLREERGDEVLFSKKDRVAFVVFIGDGVTRSIDVPYYDRPPNPAVDPYGPHRRHVVIESKPDVPKDAMTRRASW